MSTPMGRIRFTITITFVAMLGGCSERYIVASTDEALVVMEDLSTKDGLKTATIHFTPAKPVALGDRMNSIMIGSKLEATFNCRDGTSGQNAMHVMTADGTTEQRYPAPIMEKPRPGSMAASIYQIACTDQARAAASVRRSHADIQRLYARQRASDGT